MNTPYQLRVRVTGDQQMDAATAKVTRRRTPVGLSPTPSDVSPFRTNNLSKRKRPAVAPPAAPYRSTALLDLSSATRFGDLLEDRFGVRFRNRFLDGFGRAVDEVFRFL